MHGCDKGASVCWREAWKISGGRSTLVQAGILVHFDRHLPTDREMPMPIYGYECNKCGRQFETLVRSSDTPSCPACESTDLTRQLSLIAPPAKGGGASEPVCMPGGCGMCPAQGRH
jgi:putative FmdB family regulatory protein